MEQPKSIGQGCVTQVGYYTLTQKAQIVYHYVITVFWVGLHS